MKGLQIAKGLTLPLEWMTLATVVYGARGSGKTCLGRVLAEETRRAGQRFCAIDLKGDWWGLKSSSDGKSDGIPVVVFGGDHADLPLEEGAGAEVARLVAELDQSTILDFEHLSKGKQLRFQAQFFATLYDVNRNPLVLLGDEAQRYATQKPIDPDAARCLGAVEDLVKLGRKHGIAPVLFTQRGSGLNKEVSELCDLLVAFRTPGPLDQKRVEDWLDANTTKAQRVEVMGQIAGLSTGTAVFASGHPDLKLFGVHQVRRPTTFDSSATPKIGERRKEPAKLAKPDLDKIRSKMTAAIERAKADDPKALRARISELEKAAGKKAAPVAPTVERVEVPVFDEVRFNALFEELQSHVDGVAASAATAKQVIGRALVSYRNECRSAAKGKPLVVHARPGHSPVHAQSPTPARVARAPTQAEGSVALKPTERALLTAFAQSDRPLTITQAAITAGYSPTSGGVFGAAAALRKAGFLEESGEKGRGTITDFGIAALGHFDPLPTGADLAAHWYGQLNPTEAAILKAVVEAHPEGMTTADAAAKAGYSATSGGVFGACAKLRKLELVHGSPTMVADERLI